MVHWSSPDEILHDLDVFIKLIYALFGLYLWELFQTCGFEWSLITGKRKFRWSMSASLLQLTSPFRLTIPPAFFFLCRYCILFAFIGLIISTSATSGINCSALYTFISWTGNMSILCASTSLMIRTITLWERKLAVVILLGILCIAHWALLYRGMFIVHASWNSSLRYCGVVSTNPTLLKVNFFFTMGFDFVILCFTTVVLMKQSARTTSTGLWQMLFQDGLVYFLVSFTANSIPAMFNILDLNTVMNVTLTVPAAALSSIAACRVVIRLQDFKRPDAYVHSSNIIHGKSRAGASKSARFTLTRPEIHVHTEHISMSNFSPSSAARSPYGSERRASRISPDESSKDVEISYEKDSYTHVV